MPGASVRLEELADLATKSTGAGSWVWVAGFAALGVPAFVLRFSGVHLDPVVAAAIFGTGIVGGAFRSQVMGMFQRSGEKVDGV